jgi:hypothetical protein
MKTFKVHTANNQFLGNSTKFNGKLIQDNVDLAIMIKAHWCKVNNVKSFNQWADELNNSGEYEGNFTVDDAIDNLCSTYVLNISGKYVNLYEFMRENLLKK